MYQVDAADNDGPSGIRGICEKSRTFVTESVAAARTWFFSTKVEEFSNIGKAEDGANANDDDAEDDGSRVVVMRIKSATGSSGDGRMPPAEPTPGTSTGP